MASERLTVPEDNLGDVIYVIRTGLSHVAPSSISDDSRMFLAQWCNEEEAYLEADG